VTKTRLAILNEILTDINNIRKSRGIFSALVHMWKFIKAHLFYSKDNILFVRSLEDTLPDVRLVEGLTIREATVDDLHLFQSIKKPSEIMICKRLLEEKAICLIALKDKQLASYVWFASEVDPSVHLLYLPLAQDEGYSFDVYTLPAFRRQGVQSALHLRMFQLLRERGYRRVFTLVEVDNYASLRMDSKLYQVIGRLIRIKVFRLIYFRYHPKLPGEARHIIKWLGI